MTKDQLAEYMENLFEDCQEVRGEGQKEYAHDADNAFRNFEETSMELNLSPDTVLWVFVKKHLDGILAYINGHRSQREPIRGRIKDAIVYLVILGAMFHEEDKRKAPGFAKPPVLPE